MTPSVAAGAPEALRCRVLLIEDNPGDAGLVNERLSDGEHAQFEISTVRTFAAAHDWLRASLPDAILLDLNLPDSRGLDTLRRVAAIAAAVPIVVISGLVSDRLRAEARHAGAFAVHEKSELNRLFAGSVLHVIERNRARELHRQLQALLDSMPDAILVVNAAGGTRYVNQAALQLFGRTAQELLGETLVFSAPQHEPTEIVIPRAGGERICELRLAPLEWQHEAAMVAAIRDVTERKQAEALRERTLALEAHNRRVEEASRTKSAFLANMSHELRTPLNAVIGFSQMLVSGAVAMTSPKAMTFVGHILSSGQHLLQLINDVLDLAKIEAGRIEFRPEALQLDALLDEAISVLAPLAAQRDLRIVTEIHAALGEVYLDPQRFKQILYNYLSNAIKFSPEGGEITVRALPEGEAAFRMEVQDRGAGIDPEDFKRLFVEFQQLESGSAKRHQGTGLGLALTKKLAEAQGGSVGVRSEPGRGSVFHVVLPRCTGGTEEESR